MRAEVVALKKRLEEWTLRAERDAQLVEGAVRLAARERMEAADRVGAAQRGATSTVQTSEQGAHSNTSQPGLSRSTLTQSRPLI